jgi:hypothetical protein
MSNELNAALILTLDAVAGRCATKKIFSKYFCYIQTMINSLLINFTEHFQRKKVIQWLESPPLTKGFKVQSFSQILFFFHEQNELKKIAYMQIF